VIKEGSDRWQFTERVLYSTTDNVGNIKNACGHLEILHIPCIGHRYIAVRGEEML